MKVQIINRFLPINLVFLWILGCDSEGPITGYRAISITNGTLNFAGKDRTYVLQVPSSYDGTAAVPLVIGLHGHAPAANGLGFTEMGSWDVKGEEEGFIGVYPDGLNFIRSSSKGWNAGANLEQRSGGRDDVGFIAALIAKLETEYMIDAKRIFVVGTSGGGLMAYRLAAELSEEIAAIGAVSGQMVLTEIDVEEPVSIVHIHGLDDTGVPYEGGNLNGLIVPSVMSVVNRWIGINKCASEPVNIFDTEEVTGLKWVSLGNHGDIVLYDYADNSAIVTGGAARHAHVSLSNKLFS